MNRQRLIRFAALGTALALAGTAAAQTDHAPAPMMAPAKAPLSEEAYREQQAPGGRRDGRMRCTAVICSLLQRAQRRFTIATRGQNNPRNLCLAFADAAG
jgi:hypothetical protein